MQEYNFIGIGISIGIDIGITKTSFNLFKMVFLYLRKAV